jgi:hypothetical protein
MVTPVLPGKVNRTKTQGTRVCPSFQAREDRDVVSNDAFRREAFRMS